MTDVSGREPPVLPSRWLQLEPLLDAALDLPAERRDDFLADSCSGDDELRLELQRLLRDGNAAHEELDAGAVALARDITRVAPPDLHVPALLGGRYRIVRELGRGGMAVVFLAHDTQLQRTVAVKVLRNDRALTRGRDRFASEIRLTANLRHPNIIPLFDSGTDGDLRFFVMPHVEGETLSARLDRLGSHSLHDAVSIVTGVASALEYAHKSGVVHRDVKPSNIMIAAGQPLLLDFGIARSPHPDWPNLTATGQAVGTPAYMSPEQYHAADDIGPASDIYSLGAVLYELLTGRAPLTAVARLAIAEHAPQFPQSTHAISSGISPALDAVLLRAMALNLADRFGSAQEFADALQHAVARASVPVATLRIGPRRRLVGVTSVGLVALLALAGWPRVRAGTASPANRIDDTAPEITVMSAVGDSTKYLLLPYSGDTSATQRFDTADPLRVALLRWTGIGLIDAVQATEAFVSGTDADVSSRRASAAAARFGAGRYVRRDIVERNGQTYVHARVYRTGTDSLISEATVTLAAGSEVHEHAFAELADALLFADVPPELRSGSPIGTRSRPALEAFARGMGAVDRWDLPAADSVLQQATAIDATFARAELWLAQVRVWRRQPEATWVYLVRRAVARRAELSPRDQQALSALDARSRGEARRACEVWQQLAQNEVTDFSAWYAAAECDLANAAVVRDARSPSGFRFRASQHRAVQSLVRAYELLPAVHREFRAAWFAGLDDVLITTSSHMRLGFAAAPDTGVFVAYPAWDARGDSLAFVPYRSQVFSQGGASSYPATTRLAIRKQRATLLRIATTWRAAFPRSADAMMSVAIALDKLGDGTAMDSLRVARALATSPDERLRVSMAQVWLSVKYATPDDWRALSAARQLADSLVQANPTPAQHLAAPLASLAMLSGHVARAAHLVRAGPENGGGAASASLNATAAALQVFAAAGAPLDSVSALAVRVASGIERSVERGAQQGAREGLLWRALSLAFPEYRSSLIAASGAAGDDLALAQQHWLRGDSHPTRDALHRLLSVRAAQSTQGVKFETLLPEARLLAALGDHREAEERIGPSLDGMGDFETATLRSPIEAGVFVRAMALRAELAARRGDRAEAARWARAFNALWRGADDALQPMVARVGCGAGRAC